MSKTVTSNIHMKTQRNYSYQGPGSGPKYKPGSEPAPNLKPVPRPEPGSWIRTAPCVMDLESEEFGRFS